MKEYDLAGEGLVKYFGFGGGTFHVMEHFSTLEAAPDEMMESLIYDKDGALFVCYRLQNQNLALVFVYIYITVHLQYT